MGTKNLFSKEWTLRSQSLYDQFFFHFFVLSSRNSALLRLVFCSTVLVLSKIYQPADYLLTYRPRHEIFYFNKKKSKQNSVIERLQSS